MWKSCYCVEVVLLCGSHVIVWKLLCEIRMKLSDASEAAVYDLLHNHAYIGYVARSLLNPQIADYTQN